MQLEPFYTEVLSETADSVEAYSSHIFACATYQLLESSDAEKSSSNRVGQIRLYSVESKEVVTLIDKVDLNAVLDMKWCSDTLAVADSCGNGLFYSLADEKSLVLQCSLHIDDSICLSTDWISTNAPDKLAYSLSSGDLAVTHFSPTSPVVLDKWRAHSLETWIVAADRHDTNILYSGSDDCLLKMWDMRNTAKASATSKHFQMGVCSVQAHSGKEHIFAVGSYDETCSIWDNRNLRSPLTETNLGGGVWRLKWHPQYDHVILAACMHDGFKVVKYNDAFNAADVTHRYNKHDSLAYGVDWLLENNNSNEGAELENDLHATIASCSFYDKLLTVWKIGIYNF